MEIRIKEQYRNMIPALSREEYHDLKKSIQDNGVHLPIVINEQGDILDGHNRYRICQELGIEPPVVVKSFDTAEDEGIFVLEANLTRRQLTPIQRIALVHENLEPLERERARKRQLAALNEGGCAPISLVSRDTNDESGRTREIMAEKAGVSPATYSRGIVVLEKGDKEIKDAVMTGKMNITEAYHAVRPETDRKPKDKTLVLPSELFPIMKQAIDSAAEKGATELTVQYQKGTITNIGEAITLAT